MADKTVKVACEALRGDATTWRGIGAQATDLQNVVGGLTLGKAQVADSSETDRFVTTYANFQNLVASLLGKGGAAIGEMAAVLQAAADTYEREDTAGLHRVRKAGR